MSFLMAFTIIILDKKVGYMRRINATRIGKVFYSTNKRIIISTIVSGIILIILYGFTFPLGINNIVIRTLYKLIVAFIVALGLSQANIIRTMNRDAEI